MYGCIAFRRITPTSVDAPLRTFHRATKDEKIGVIRDHAFTPFDLEPRQVTLALAQAVFHTSQTAPDLHAYLESIRVAQSSYDPRLTSLRTRMAAIPIGEFVAIDREKIDECIEEIETEAAADRLFTLLTESRQGGSKSTHAYGLAIDIFQSIASTRVIMYLTEFVLPNGQTTPMQAPYACGTRFARRRHQWKEQRKLKTACPACQRKFGAVTVARPQQCQLQCKQTFCRECCPQSSNGAFHCQWMSAHWILDHHAVWLIMIMMRVYVPVRLPAAGDIQQRQVAIARSRSVVSCAAPSKVSSTRRMIAPMVPAPLRSCASFSPPPVLSHLVGPTATR